MRRNAPPLHPAWVFTAYWDALNNRPMSVSREKKLCEAMGLNKPPRASRRFYRPCLSVELGEAIRESGINVEDVLLWYIEMTKEANAAEAKRGMVGHEELAQEFEL